jgi:hypothetical protein
MKPQTKAESRWLIWRSDYPKRQRLDKFSRWAKRYMNRVRRRTQNRLGSFMTNVLAEKDSTIANGAWYSAPTMAKIIDGIKWFTVKDVAESVGVAKSTVRWWLMEKRFPNAELYETDANTTFWLIPETDLVGVKKRPPGPAKGAKPKKKSKKKKKS